MQKLIGYLKSRLALNIYFWAFAVILSFYLNFHTRGRHYEYAAVWYYLFRTITVVLLAALVYVNNLVLVPRYFIKKRYWKYFFSVILLAYLVGLCYAGLFEWLDIHFPKIEMEDISIFSAVRDDVDTKWKLWLEGLSWLFTMAITTSFFTIAWYMHDYSKQKKISAEAQRKQIEAELNFLKSQINPHFLFNTLNNLYTLTLIKSDHAPDIVAKLSSILRYMLYESNSSETSFEREKEIMQAYIDLELLRITNKNGFKFHIESDKDYNIPPLLWVPVLENVFKHGTRFISPEYDIEYRFIIHQGSLSIYSKNTYAQAQPVNGKEKGGIGLDNLKKRLALLFPAKHVLYSGKEGDYFITNVLIQLA